MTARDERASAAHEAALLLESFRDWLDARVVHERPIATGSAECRACPLCLALSALREQHPDVVEHLGKAADAVVSAIRSVIVEHEQRWSTGDPPDVQRIDVE